MNAELWTRELSADKEFTWWYLRSEWVRHKLALRVHPHHVDLVRWPSAFTELVLLQTFSSLDEAKTVYLVMAKMETP